MSSWLKRFLVGVAVLPALVMAAGTTTSFPACPGTLVGYNNAPPQHDGLGHLGHFILQLDNNGAYQWHSLYGVERWDEASSVAVDSQHNVFVSGWSGYSGWNGDNNTFPLNPSNSAASEVFVMKFGPAAKVTPVITWSNPADIFFGSALGSTQLNATANVQGTFVYTPAAGTVLQAGALQTLSTTFTPTDVTDYSTAAKTVKINVNPTSPPTSPAQIVVTKTLARIGNQVVVSLNISNPGGADALNVQLTVGKIGNISGTPLPSSLGTVPAGKTVTATLTFPGTVGATGTPAVLTVSGAYTGGSFSSASRIALP